MPLLVSLPSYSIITSGCALTGVIVHSLILIPFLATVFTKAPTVVIASTLIDFTCNSFYFILLPYIQLYSTAVNAAFNAAAVLQSLLCYSPIILESYSPSSN